MMLNDNDISDCVMMICTNLPVLREMLKLSQADVAVICGSSRQKIIQFEHQKAKVTRSILIALVTYFSLRPKTALFLKALCLYKNRFVQTIGFNEEVAAYIIDNHINESKI